MSSQPAGMVLPGEPHENVDRPLRCADADRHTCPRSAGYALPRLTGARRSWRDLRARSGKCERLRPERRRRSRGNRITFRPNRLRCRLHAEGTIPSGGARQGERCGCPLTPCQNTTRLMRAACFVVAWEPGSWTRLIFGTTKSSAQQIRMTPTHMLQRQ